MIEIIPATDIIGGQCVRLTQGDYASRKTDYGRPFSAALGSGNFFGTQFHPEKSGAAGARILLNFLNL